MFNLFEVLSLLRSCQFPSSHPCFLGVVDFFPRGGVVREVTAEGAALTNVMYQKREHRLAFLSVNSSSA